MMQNEGETDWTEKKIRETLVFVKQRYILSKINCVQQLAFKNKKKNNPIYKRLKTLESQKENKQNRKLKPNIVEGKAISPNIFPSTIFFDL